MGNQPSKLEQLSESLNTISLNVMTEMSTEGAGAITNTQTINFAGTVRGANIEQKATIRLDVLAGADTNAGMQSTIITEMIASLERRNTDFPQIARGMDTSRLHTIVSNEVSNSLSQSSLARLALAVGNTQTVNFDRGGKYEKIRVTQEATSVGQLVNNMSARLANQLLAESATSAQSSSTTTNFASDIIGSIGGAISGIINSVGGIFGLSPMTIILLLAVVLVGGFLLKRRIDSMPGATMKQIVGMEGWPNKKQLKQMNQERAAATTVEGNTERAQKKTPADPLEGLFQGRGEDFWGAPLDPLNDTLLATPFQGGEHVSYPTFSAEAI